MDYLCISSKNLMVYNMYKKIAESLNKTISKAMQLHYRFVLFVDSIVMVDDAFWSAVHCECMDDRLLEKCNIAQIFLNHSFHNDLEDSLYIGRICSSGKMWTNDASRIVISL